MKVTVEVQGKLKLLDADKKERQIPLSVSGDFLYDEKTSATPTLWSSRYYQTAAAKIQLDKTTHQPGLGETHRLVGVQVDGTKSRFWSPGGPLSRDEVELIDLQANSALLPGLLPQKAVKVGDAWSLSETLLASLLTIDAVSAQDVTCKLAEVREGRAVVEIQGKISGAVEGVSTEIELTAKYGYHLAERRFTSLVLVLKENRAIGQAEAGFDVSGRITMVLTPLASSSHLTAPILAELQKGLGMAPPLRYESVEQGFRALLDPRWRVVIDRAEVTVVRLFDGGEVIAQCNISSLPPLEAGRRLQLEEFQKDIQRSLGKNFGQFLEASQSETPKGLRLLRVAAAGQASELAIHWIYYHASNDQGHRLTYVFTMEADKAERFAAADSAVSANLELFAPTPSAQPEGPAAQEARAK